ncbi:MAG: hypothetical protein M1831_004651 [Alyxoria varia]|nr:MAG: hypothetical protein M1831_004651 [Alyxoria varia]
MAATVTPWLDHVLDKELVQAISWRLHVKPLAQSAELEFQRGKLDLGDPSRDRTYRTDGSNLFIRNLKVHQSMGWVQVIQICMVADMDMEKLDSYSGSVIAIVSDTKLKIRAKFSPAALTAYEREHGHPFLTKNRLACLIQIRGIDLEATPYGSVHGRLTLNIKGFRYEGSSGQPTYGQPSFAMDDAKRKSIVQRILSGIGLGTNAKRSETTETSESNFILSQGYDNSHGVLGGNQCQENHRGNEVLPSHQDLTNKLLKSDDYQTSVRAMSEVYATAGMAAAHDNGRIAPARVDDGPNHSTSITSKDSRDHSLRKPNLNFNFFDISGKKLPKIPEDQMKILTKKASWMYPEVGYTFPSANIPVPLIERFDEFAKRGISKNLSASALGSWNDNAAGAPAKHEPSLQPQSELKKDFSSKQDDQNEDSAGASDNDLDERSSRSESPLPWSSSQVSNTQGRGSLPPDSSALHHRSASPDSAHMNAQPFAAEHAAPNSSLQLNTQYKPEETTSTSQDGFAANPIRHFSKASHALQKLPNVREIAQETNEDDRENGLYSRSTPIDGPAIHSDEEMSDIECTAPRTVGSHSLFRKPAYKELVNLSPYQQASRVSEKISCHEESPPLLKEKSQRSMHSSSACVPDTFNRASRAHGFRDPALNCTNSGRSPSRSERSVNAQSSRTRNDGVVGSSPSNNYSSSPPIPRTENTMANTTSSQPSKRGKKHKAHSHSSPLANRSSKRLKKEHKQTEEDASDASKDPVQMARLQRRQYLQTYAQNMSSQDSGDSQDDLPDKSVSSKSPLQSFNDIFERFKREYPMFSGSVDEFLGLCIAIDNLRKHGSNLPESSWDDFIVRHRSLYPAYLKKCSREERPILPYERFYETFVTQQRYLKCVINPRALEAVLRQEGLLASGGSKISESGNDYSQAAQREPIENDTTAYRPSAEPLDERGRIRQDPQRQGSHEPLLLEPNKEGELSEALMQQEPASAPPSEAGFPTSSPPRVVNETPPPPPSRTSGRKSEARTARGRPEECMLERSSADGGDVESSTSFPDSNEASSEVLPLRSKEWWEEEDTPFKEMWRNYAQIRDVRGALGDTNGPQVLGLEAKKFRVFEWHLGN